ncbi:hypothetical protein L1049_012089 [Liquidambar formosana]|uniref:Uncharacterized protein n=1 Tax=Liquidambar formosana TaxID=63359 RepID=A0AAP0RZA6_LIQFO
MLEDDYLVRRCSSDPYNSPEMTNNVGAPPPNQILDSYIGSGCFWNPQSPDNTTAAAKINVNATTPPSPLRGNSLALSPLPPTLRRSVSDPTSSAYQTPVDSIKEESPNSKALIIPWLSSGHMQFSFNTLKE